MKQQTAVEWFTSELSGHLGPSNSPELFAIFQQALAMEKEQIIEFAKLHVEKALEAASKSVKYNRPYIEVKDSILNAYPLDNIK